MLFKKINDALQKWLYGDNEDVMKHSRKRVGNSTIFSRNNKTAANGAGRSDSAKKGQNTGW